MILVHERVRRLDEFIPATTFYFAGISTTPTCRSSCRRTATPRDAKLLEAALEIVDANPNLDKEILETRFRDLAAAHDWKPRELFMTLRVAVTGRTVSPPLLESMQVIGREITRRRLRQAAAFLKGA